MEPNENIIIPNLDQLNKKIKQFTSSNFHVVSDFDQTITKHRDKDGKRCTSVFGQIRKHNYLGEEYSKKSYEMYNYYFPIENNHNLSLDIKSKAMLEWWEKHLKLVIEYGLTKKMLHDIAKNKEINLRDNGQEFFKILADMNIPLLIFSAGLGDIIEHFLEKKIEITKNIHIISNFYNFSENGKILSTKQQLIHTFNKNEVAVKEHPYYQEIEERENVILMGDKLADLGMSEGMQHQEIIKIGFLNENKDELLDKFKESFDIIIINDGSFEYINQLLNKILSS
jgi:cytosolic 5'-nucleotidase 3